MNKKITQAVILAGGRGERLRPFTDNLPKQMFSVNGRPFLEYLLASLKKSGIEEAVLLVGYLKEKIIEHFGNGERFNLRIKYSIGVVEDDTGTRLRNAKDLLAPEFLLLYGDVYWPALDLKKMNDFYYSVGKLGLAIVCDKGENNPNFEVNDKNDVLSYIYGREANDNKFNWTEVGYFILNKKITDFMPAGINFNFNKVTLPDLVKRDQLVAWKTTQAPETITTPEHLSDFANKMKSLGL